MEHHDITVLGSLELPNRDPATDLEATPRFYVDKLKASPVFITDVTPQSTGIVGAKQYQAGTVPANAVLIRCTSDTPNVRIHFLVEGSSDTYSPPSIRVENMPVQSIVQHPTVPRLFQCFHDLNVLTSSIIEVEVGTGLAQRLASIELILALSGPSITALNIGTFPNSQTAIKLGDLVPCSGLVDNTCQEVRVQDFGAAQETVMTLGAVDSGGAGRRTFSGNFTASNRTGVLTIRARGTNALGTGGTIYTSANTAQMDQTSPVFGTPTVTYPAGQQALKGSEQATLNLGCTNFDQISYTTSSDLMIGAPTVYTPTKTLTRLGGATVIGINNVTATATKASNGSSSQVQVAVSIASVVPTCSIVVPASSLHSSPAGIQHLITLQANQPLLSSPNVTAEDGLFQGTWTYNSDSDDYTRQLLVRDSDPRGQSLFTVVLTNLAGMTGLVITDGSVYTIGGLSLREVVFPAGARYTAIGSTVLDINKTRAKYSGADDNLELVANTNDLTGSYTITDSAGVYDPNGGYLFINDQAFAGANTSGTLTLEFEEIV